MTKSATELLALGVLVVLAFYAGADLLSSPDQNSSPSLTIPDQSTLTSVVPDFQVPVGGECIFDDDLMMWTFQGQVTNSTNIERALIVFVTFYDQLGVEPDSTLTTVPGVEPGEKVSFVLRDFGRHGGERPDVGTCLDPWAKPLT